MTTPEDSVAAKAGGEYRTIQRCSITGEHDWRDLECANCGARIRRDLPTREQVRKFHADRKIRGAK